MDDEERSVIVAWIESHQSLLRHRKTLRAASLLKIGRHQLIGHLHALWWWALDNVAEDGDLSGISDSEIDAAAEYDAGGFAEALAHAGFLDGDADEARSLHDWSEYAGRLLRQRRAHSQRMRDARAGRVLSTSPERDEPPYPTVPYRTLPNHTEENQEKSPPVDHDSGEFQEPEWLTILHSTGPIDARKHTLLIQWAKGHSPTVLLEAAHNIAQKVDGLSQKQKKNLGGTFQGWVGVAERRLSKEGGPIIPQPGPDGEEPVYGIDGNCPCGGDTCVPCHQANIENGLPCLVEGGCQRCRAEAMTHPKQEGR